MRKAIILFGFLFYLAFTATAGAVVVKTIEMSEGMTLSAVLGEEWNKVDSISVSGSLAYDDVHTLLRCARDGRLSGIDMRHCTLPADSLPENAFSGATHLCCIVLPERLRSIGHEAFLVCRDLKHASLPVTLQFIGSSAFAYSGLSGCLGIPAGVCSIEAGTFESCHSLTGLVLPDGLERIEAGALRFTAISHIDLPWGLRYIGPCAFTGSALKSVTIPETVEEIGWGAFGCHALEEVHLPNGLTHLQPETFSNSALRVVDWPENLQVIGEQAFASTGFERLLLPEGLRQIDEKAFAGCHSLTVALLPASVSVLSESAFDYCPLKNLYCLSTVPPTVIPRTTYPAEAQARSVAEKATLYVPLGSGDAYRSSYYWSEFDRIVETDNFTTGVESILEMSDKSNAVYMIDGRKATSGHLPCRKIYIKGKRTMMIK